MLYMPIRGVGLSIQHKIIPTMGQESWSKLDFTTGGSGVCSTVRI